MDRRRWHNLGVGMLVAGLIVALALAAPAEDGEERVTIEGGVGYEVLYPPAIKEPRRHIGYGLAILASLRAGSRFKAMIGPGFDHVVGGWLGEPDVGVPQSGPWRGTAPATYRGQLFRALAVARFGLENEFAYGFFGVAPGYTARIAALTCSTAPCTRSRTSEHGLNLGVRMGALVGPEAWGGFVAGGEVGLDWGWFARHHPMLPAWNQGMHVRLMAGYSF